MEFPVQNYGEFHEEEDEAFQDQEVLDRADAHFRRVKDDPRLAAEHRRDLDYGLMLLLHHRTQLQESSQTATQAQRKVLKDLQEWMFINWDFLEDTMATQRHSQILNDPRYKALTDSWVVQLKHEEIYDIASCLKSFSRVFENTTSGNNKEKRDFLTNVWDDINQIIITRLRLPMLQVPYYRIL